MTTGNRLEDGNKIYLNSIMVKKRITKKRRNRKHQKIRKGGDGLTPIEKYSVIKNLNLVRTPDGNLTIESSELIGAVFKNVLLQNVVFKNVNFESAQFEDCRFDHVTFQDCNLSKASFSSSTEPSPAHIGLLQRGGVGLYNVDFNGYKTKMVEGTFHNIEMDRVMFHFHLIHVKFDRVHLLDSSFYGGIYTSDFSHSHLKNVIFRRAIITNTTFHHANIENMSIVQHYLTKLHEVDFSNAVISHSNFGGTKITNSSFHGARLDHIDFTDIEFGDNNDGGNIDFTNTQFTNIIHDSGILRRLNVPSLNDNEQVPDQPGIAFEIHNASDRFDRNTFLQLIAPDQPSVNWMGMTKEDFMKSIWDTLLSTYPTEPRPPNLMRDIDAITAKLVLSDKLDSNGIRNLIHKIVEFVHKQSPEFVVSYVDTFLEDCVHAYPLNPNVPPDRQDRMSCVQGIVERFYMSLGSVLFLYCNDVSCPNPTYKELFKLFSMKIDNNELLQKWYQQTQTEDGDTKDTYEKMSEQARYDDFVKFMEKEYKRVFNVNRLSESQMKEITDFADSQTWVRTLILGGNRRTRHAVNRKTRRKSTR